MGTGREEHNCILDQLCEWPKHEETRRMCKKCDTYSCFARSSDTKAFHVGTAVLFLSCEIERLKRRINGLEEQNEKYLSMVQGKNSHTELS